MCNNNLPTFLQDMIDSYWETENFAPRSDYDEFLGFKHIDEADREISRVALGELDSILYRLVEDTIISDSVEETLYNVMEAYFEGIPHAKAREYALSQLPAVAEYSGFPYHFHAVIQKGYCIFGTGVSPEDAVRNAQEWMANDTRIVPLSESADGDMVCIPCTLEVFLEGERADWDIQNGICIVYEGDQ